jgi:hypothetical protein
MEYVNVPRLIVDIKHFIEEGANWAVFERNERSRTTSARRHERRFDAA